MNEGQYMKVDEVAERLNVSKMTVYRLIHAGRIACLKAGPRSFRIPRGAVEAYINSNTQEAVSSDGG